MTDGWLNSTVNSRQEADDKSSEADDRDVFIIAVTSLCVIALLVLSVILFITWWCWVHRKERQTSSRKARHKEHLKYLEEYSIRTEDEDNEANEIASEQNSPRSLNSNTQDASLYRKSGDQNHNDSGFGIDDWAPHKVDHSTSLEASNASSAMIHMRKWNTNDNLSSAADNHGYVNSDELVTNLDDVKL